MSDRGGCKDVPVAVSSTRLNCCKWRKTNVELTSWLRLFSSLKMILFCGFGAVVQRLPWSPRGMIGCVLHSCVEFVCYLWLRWFPPTVQTRQLTSQWKCVWGMLVCSGMDCWHVQGCRPHARLVTTGVVCSTTMAPRDPRILPRIPYYSIESGFKSYRILKSDLNFSLRLWNWKPGCCCCLCILCLCEHVQKVCDLV